MEMRADVRGRRRQDLTDVALERVQRRHSLGVDQRRWREHHSLLLCQLQERQHVQRRGLDRGQPISWHAPNGHRHSHGGIRKRPALSLLPPSMSTDAHRRQGRLSEMVADDVPPELLEAESRELVQQDTDTPVRHLRIDWPSSSIKGVYAIGSSVPHANPPLYDAPDVKDVEGNATSAVFTSRRSPINVTVLVLHGQGQRTPQTPSSEAPPDVGDPMQLLEVERKNTVFVSARTHLNSACVHVPSYAGRKPLHIKVQTHSGNATVILPHSFNGLLTWKVEAGLFHMSPGAASHAMRLGDKEHRHHGMFRMVADPDLPSWMTAQGRRGDVCEIKVHTGRIYVCMSGEKKSSAAKGCVIC